MTGPALSRERGFTLVELQISLVIVALMAVLMSGALRLSAKTWRSVNQQQDQVEHRYLVAQYLRRHLSSARFDQVNTQNNGSVIGFFGNDEQVNFAAPYPAFHNDGELYWWNLRLQRGNQLGQYNLVASYFPFGSDNDSRDGDADPKGGAISSNNSITNRSLLKLDKDGILFFEGVEPSRIVIAENMTDLVFEYYYRDEQGVQKWVREWPPGSVAPLLIRINITSAVRASWAESGIEYSALPEILITPRFADQKMHVESLDGAR